MNSKSTEEGLCSHNRRRFLMTVSVAGSVAGASALLPAFSLQASQIAPVTKAVKAGSRGVDEALENYPGYSANIGYGRGATHYRSDEIFSDPQLMV